MKNLLYLLLLLFLPFITRAQNLKAISEQPPNGNYDESRMPAYTLPDPLIFNNGSKVLRQTGLG